MAAISYVIQDRTRGHPFLRLLFWTRNISVPPNMLFWKTSVTCLVKTPIMKGRHWFFVSVHSCSIMWLSTHLEYIDGWQKQKSYKNSAHELEFHLFLYWYLISWHCRTLSSMGQMMVWCNFKIENVVKSWCHTNYSILNALMHHTWNTDNENVLFKIGIKPM